MRKGANLLNQLSGKKTGVNAAFESEMKTKDAEGFADLDPSEEPFAR